MKKIIILGAGGAAYNIAEYVEDINEKNPTWDLLGFLDDNPKLLGTNVLGYPVIGTIDDSVNYPDAFFISSIGSANDLDMRKRVRERVPFGNDHFATLIHPRAHVSRYAKIESGCIICPLCSVQAGCVVGHDCYITSFTLVGHESNIGAHCVIAGRTMIAGSAEIGECCYIGCGSAFKHEIVIGHHTMIGMGSVLWKDVPPYSKMYAPHARTRNERDTEKKLLSGEFNNQ